VFGSSSAATRPWPSLQQLRIGLLKRLLVHHRLQLQALAEFVIRLLQPFDQPVEGVRPRFVGLLVEKRLLVHFHALLEDRLDGVGFLLVAHDQGGDAGGRDGQGEAPRPAEEGPDAPKGAARQRDRLAQHSHVLRQHLRQRCSGRDLIGGAARDVLEFEHRDAAVADRCGEAAVRLLGAHPRRLDVLHAALVGSRGLAHVRVELVVLRDQLDDDTISFSGHVARIGGAKMPL
jgi:hypothetical protein